MRHIKFLIYFLGLISFSFIELGLIIFISNSIGIKNTLLLIASTTIFGFLCIAIRFCYCWFFEGYKKDFFQFDSENIKNKLLKLKDDNIITKLLEFQVLGFSAILILIPGLITDLIGIILIFPPFGIIYRKKQKIKFLQKIEESEKMTDTIKKPKGPEPVDELLHVDLLGLEIGYGLIKLVDASKGGDLLERINGIRRQFAIDLGLVIPPIRIRDNMQLEANEYHIKLKGDIIAKYEIMPEFYFAMNPSGKKGDLVGIQTKEPAFNLPATWVNETEKERAESIGYSVVDATTVLATHIKEMLKKHAHEILIREDIAVMIKNYNKRFPSVLESIYPEKISLAQIHNIFRNLLREQVSIRNINTIFETIGDYVARIKDIEILTEYIRISLKRNICQKLKTEDNKLFFITLDPKLEEHFKNSLHKSEFGTNIVIEPHLKSKFIELLTNELSNASNNGISPVILTSPTIRIYLRKLIEKDLPYVVILSYAEIADNIIHETLSQINIDSNKQ